MRIKKTLQLRDSGEVKLAAFVTGITSNVRHKKIQVRGIAN